MSGKLYLMQDLDVQIVLPLFRDRFKNSDGSALMYNVAQLHVSKRYSKHVEIKFYSNRDFTQKNQEENSINEIFFLSVMTLLHFKESIVLFSSPTDKISTDMMTSLENTLDWSIPYTFGDLSSTQVPLFEELCVKANNADKATEYRYFYLDIAAGQLLQQNPIPATLKIKELGLNDATVVDEKWGFAPPGFALSLIEDAIETIGSIGVYEESENGNGGELVSWLIISQIGTMNALHTDEKHRLKGYGEMALRAMVNFAATKREIISVCHVRNENTNSIKLMEKIGLKQGSNKTWLDASNRL